MSNFGSLSTGRILADASIFISCAMTLAVFNIEKFREGDLVLEPDLEQTTGTIRCVAPPFYRNSR